MDWPSAKCTQVQTHGGGERGRESVQVEKTEIVKCIYFDYREAGDNCVIGIVLSTLKLFFFILAASEEARNCYRFKCVREA